MDFLLEFSLGQCLYFFYWENYLVFKYTDVAWRQAAEASMALHDCGLLIGYIYCASQYIWVLLAAGRRLPFLMPSRPERRLSRVWPQCMIVSQRAHCPKQILGQFKAYSTYWICCTHAFYTCDTSDILRKLRVQLERYTFCGPVTMWDSDEWVKKKGKCHKNITPPNVWGR